MKRVCRERGLPIVEYVVLYRDQLDAGRVLQTLPSFPLFVKPANLGSSVGISKVARPRRDSKPRCAWPPSSTARSSWSAASSGREFECSVLGNEEPMASLPCEILPSQRVLRLRRQVSAGPREDPASRRSARRADARVRRLAVECYQAVECEGMARVDFLLEAATGKLYINEINTIPGFTSISMYPKMWEHSGIAFAQLIDRLIELAHRAARGEEGYAVHAIK